VRIEEFQIGGKGQEELLPQAKARRANDLRTI
jgi:hypothetical protein